MNPVRQKKFIQSIDEGFEKNLIDRLEESDDEEEFENMFIEVTAEDGEEVEGEEETAEKALKEAEEKAEIYHFIYIFPSFH